MGEVSSRDRLLAAAVRLFGENGYRETSVGDIEAAAGLTRRAGGFYRHFASKEQILAAAVRRMSEEMIGELRLEDVVASGSTRAELLLIARTMLRHAEAYRPLRLLLLTREVHKLPAVRAAVKQANARLAALDVVPWMERALRRAGRRGDPRETGLLVFGPVLLYLISLDRGDPAFGIDDASRFLSRWAEHWAAWLEPDRPPPS